MYNSAIYLVQAYAHEYKIRHLGFIIHFDTMVSFYINAQLCLNQVNM